MKICLIGDTGFVGRTVYEYLNDKYEVTGINSKTENIPSDKFNLIINCAGNAKKFLADKDPEKIKEIRERILEKILQINCKNIIHISSIDASSFPDNNYTMSKLVMEKCIKILFPKWIILRLGGMVGPYLKKNVVYDIVNNKNLFVNFNSNYNYISTQEVASIVDKIINMNLNKEIINVAACEPIQVKEIIDIAKKYDITFDGSEGESMEDYKDVNIDRLSDFFEAKSSKHYISEYLKQYSSLDSQSH